MRSTFLKRDSLVPWLAELAKTHRVLAPRQEGDAVVFRPFDGQTAPFLDRPATNPPKGAVFPAHETLLTFQYAKNAEDLGQVDVQVKETVAAEPTVVFGSRPCDARGFLIFDRVYDTQTVQDVDYKARREATAFVTLACTSAASTCFCHRVGSGPADAAGSDVLVTPVADGYILEAVSDKGQQLLKSSLLQEAGDKAAQAQAVKDKALAAMPEGRSLAGAVDKLLALFDEMGDGGFWQSVSAKCVSCGACTYLCPTCYCFNITDERCGMKGSRIRSWDNCMSFLFTMEASGHNPRPTKAHRLKNRVGHKFSYYPALHEGLIACCGCGRCIKSCPVSVDIREIVEKALDAAIPSKQPAA